MNIFKKYFFLSFAFFTLIGIFHFHTSEAYTVSMPNQVCAYKSASNYTYHCNSHVTMNIPTNGYYNSGDFLDVQFWTDDYTDPIPFESPNYTTFNSVSGTSHNCSNNNDNLPCKNWESNDYSPGPDPSMFAGQDGCYYMNVWYKWGFPTSTGNYEYSVTIPYKVGSGSCGSSGSGMAPTVTATADPVSISSGGSSVINYTSTNSVSCDIYKSSVLQAKHCPVSGLYYTGSLTTGTTNTTYQYTVTCGQGATYTGSPVGDCDGAGSSYAINSNKEIIKDNYFAKIKDFFSKGLILISSAEQVDLYASKDVNSTVTPPLPTVVPVLSFYIFPCRIFAPYKKSNNGKNRII